ncbi:MAG: ribosome-binding factor A [Candidatus Falkowbacteria bacterium]|nr:ribosome-binding factor A [Candidatus Falkowbacteria bacterium]
MARVDKINELLRHNISQIISRSVEVPNVLITITFVDCSPDLHNAKIGVSVLPKNLTGSALNKLKENTSLIVRELNKVAILRKIPRIIWTIDDTEARLTEIDEVFFKIEKERN